MEDQSARYSTISGLAGTVNGTVSVTNIETTLEQRGSKYGSFVDQGRIEQNIKRAMQDSPNWNELPDDSKCALEMIATKISRILKGDPEYDDSWRDIAGYAVLIEKRINGVK
jgi:hypothetical protein